MIEEKLCRFIQERAAGNYRTAVYVDETSFHQGCQHSINVHAADCFNVGSCDRLPVSNNRECLERGRGQARRLGRRKKLAHPRRKRWICCNLPAFGFFDNLQTAVLLDVFHFQLLERCGNFRFFDIREFIRRKVIFSARTFNSRGQFTRRERLLCAEEQSFNDSRKCHESWREPISKNEAASSCEPFRLSGVAELRPPISLRLMNSSRSRSGLRLQSGSPACRSCPVRGLRSADGSLTRSQSSAKERGLFQKVPSPLRPRASSLQAVRRVAVFLLQEHCAGPGDIFPDASSVYLRAEQSGA